MSMLHVHAPLLMLSMFPMGVRTLHFIPTQEPCHLVLWCDPLTLILGWPFKFVLLTGTAIIQDLFLTDRTRLQFQYSSFLWAFKASSRVSNDFSLPTNTALKSDDWRMTGALQERLADHQSSIAGPSFEWIFVHRLAILELFAKNTKTPFFQISKERLEKGGNLKKALNQTKLLLK